LRFAISEWESVLQGILSPDDPDSFPWQVISARHRSSLLDWRLGLSYLRILHDPQYSCGLDGQFTTPELDVWLDSATKLSKNFASQFGYQHQTWGCLPGFETGIMRVLIVHPLWDTYNRRGIYAKAVAAAGGASVHCIDTFNLLRRPGWCHTELAKEGGL